MLKSMKTLAILAFVVAGLVAATPAKADQAENVNLTFQSGATFVGTLDFSSDYSQITGVSGTLTDYWFTPWYSGVPALWSGPECGTPSSSGPTGACLYLNYVLGDTTYISWVDEPGTNFATDSVDNFGTYLMDGTSEADYLNFIAFTYVLSGTSTVTFALDDNDGDSANTSGVEINYYDPLVSGSIAPTPEPSSLLLLGSGLVGLAGLVRRKIGLHA
jgi:hypothetical protein